MKLRKTIHNGKPCWEVDGGKRGGKRRRYYYTTKKAAEKRLGQLQADERDTGRRWTDLPAAERAEVVEILEEIRGAGLTLGQVWHGFQHSGQMPVRPISLAQAIEGVLKAKQSANRRAAYVRSLGYYLRAFAEGREARELHSISATEISLWFIERKEAPATQASSRGRLSALFKWGITHGHCVTNPVTGLEKVSIDEKPPAIFTVAECRALMQAAVDHDPGMLGELTLMLFAGLRPEEAKAISWESIDLERKLVRVEAGIAKNRRRRLIDLEDNAVAWLKRTTELPIAKNRRRRLNALRLAAGLREWPHDVLRHTAASHLYARHGATKAAMILGHSERMLFRHYREMVSPQENQEFWGI